MALVEPVARMMATPCPLNCSCMCFELLSAGHAALRWRGNGMLLLVCPGCLPVSVYVRVPLARILCVGMGAPWLGTAHGVCVQGVCQCNRFEYFNGPACNIPYNEYIGAYWTLFIVVGAVLSVGLTAVRACACV